MNRQIYSYRKLTEIYHSSKYNIKFLGDGQYYTVINIEIPLTNDGRLTVVVDPVEIIE